MRWFLVFILSSFAAGADWTDIIEVPDKYVHDVMTAELTDMECLALNVYHEARNQSVLGQMLVAQVTVNRMRHKGYPDTACGVVRQHRQFSWTHDGKVDHAHDRKAYETAYLIAIKVLALGQMVDVQYSGLLLNYHATYVSPDWHNLHPVMIYGDHVFYVRKSDWASVRSIRNFD